MLPGEQIERTARRRGDSRAGVGRRWGGRRQRGITASFLVASASHAHAAWLVRFGRRGRATTTLLRSFGFGQISPRRVASPGNERTGQTPPPVPNARGPPPAVLLFHTTPHLNWALLFHAGWLVPHPGASPSAHPTRTLSSPAIRAIC
jgi:hypothetical protein